MNKTLCALIVALAAVGGCSTESRLYGDKPLVADVDTGMTKEQVLQIGGPPQLISERTVVAGTCFDYTLTQDGQKQAYNVSFDAQGKVDHQSFLSCAEWSMRQQKSRNPPRSKNKSGAGYKP